MLGFEKEELKLLSFSELICFLVLQEDKMKFTA